MKNEVLLCKMMASDLEKPLNLYASTIGVDNLFKLCELAGGQKIYLPKPDSFFKSLRKRLIIADYRSGNHTIESLVKDYGLSVKTVHTYIRK